MLSEDDFLLQLSRASASSSWRYALAFLAFKKTESPHESYTSGAIVRVLSSHKVANLNATRLSDRLDNEPMVVRGKFGFSLKSAALPDVVSEFPTALTPPAPSIDDVAGFLPQAVWANTRGYIEEVCHELNGCVQMSFYTAAAVLVRRLIETLIIEAYCAKGREAEIQGSDGHFKMLSGLVSAAKGDPGLSIGRDGKQALDVVKQLGDRSAHNPRFMATLGDLQKVESGVRVLADELIALAELRRGSRE